VGEVVRASTTEVVASTDDVQSDLQEAFDLIHRSPASYSFAAVIQHSAEEEQDSSFLYPILRV
jgi:hypothetical protein